MIFLTVFRIFMLFNWNSDNIYLNEIKTLYTICINRLVFIQAIEFLLASSVPSHRQTVEWHFKCFHICWSGRDHKEFPLVIDRHAPVDAHVSVIHTMPLSSRSVGLCCVVPDASNCRVENSPAFAKGWKQSQASTYVHTLPDPTHRSPGDTTKRNRNRIQST